VDLEDVADELYEVPPEEFTALRTQRRDEARDAGDRGLAKAIAELPKPSTAAWVCNLLVRARRAEIESLVELGDLLRAAQEDLAGDQLKALNRQRSQLLTALTRQASALAREQGHRVSSAIESQVEDTLRAAMADQDAGEALLSGRLTAAMSYSGGLGTTGGRPQLRLVAPPPTERPARPDRPARPRGAEAAARRREEEERRREEERRAAEERRQRELAEARSAVEQATAVAREAREAADAEQARVDDLDARRADLQARVDELAEALARAEEETTAVGEQLQRATRHARTAERQATRAEAARDSAVAALEALEARG
jgi:hypothetical protein